MKSVFLLVLAAARLVGADATGVWSGTLTNPQSADGSSSVVSAYLVLTQRDDGLTGTGGPDASEQHPIQNGKAENDVVTIEIVAGDALKEKQG